MNNNNSKTQLDSIIRDRKSEFPYIKQIDRFIMTDENNNKNNKSNENINKITNLADSESNNKLVLNLPNNDQIPDNDFDKYIKPSTMLKNNILPKIDSLYYIDYLLSLDIRDDVLDSNDFGNHIPEYGFKFSKFGNISKIELVSVIVSANSLIKKEPYLFICFKEFEGRCFLSNGKRTFGKINYSELSEDYILYKPEDCYQDYSKPISLDKLTISICDNKGSPINLREVKVSEIKKDKNGDGHNNLIVICPFNHHLKNKDKLEIHFELQSKIESYDVEVIEVIDQISFKIKNEFDQLSSKMKIYRNDIVLSISLKLYEINWFILNDTSIQTTQLVRLTQLVQEKNKSINVD